MKLTVIGATALTLGFTSCGGGMPSTMREYLEVQVEIMEKSMGLAIDDSEGRQKVQDQYKAELEACEEIGKVFDDKNKNLSREDRVAAKEKELDGCDAMDRMEELYDEQMSNLKK